MDRPSELPIADADWNQTPPAVQAVVVGLYQQVKALQTQVEALQAEVTHRREQLGQNSRNSSRPPSSDPPSAARSRPQRAATGRKAGDQTGHTGHGRRLKAEVKPTSCKACGALLMGDDAEAVRHQVTELPRIQPEVSEYRFHTLTCAGCGAKTEAERPDDVPTGSFGPRTQATVGYLAGRMGASQRDVEEMMENLFHVEMGLDTVPALEQAVSEALDQPVQEVQDYVQQQDVANMDETSWREGTKRAWLWEAATTLVTLFVIIGSRSGKAAQQVIGETFKGVVGSDRCWAYTWQAVLQRQLCWAHLKRDFQAFVERGGEPEQIGRALLDCVGQMFGLWHRVRDGTLSRADFQVKMQPIQRRVGELLREGSTLAHAKTRRTCENILKLEAALWTFVHTEGVEPTNNLAERLLRRAVLPALAGSPGWRRRSFGTQSEAGSRFVERTLTAITTLRQQKRDVLDYLTEACATAIRGGKAPSLLPEPAVINVV